MRMDWIHPYPSQQQATYKVLHTTSCILQSNAPEDGHNYCPETCRSNIVILINCLLWHLVDCFSLLYMLKLRPLHVTGNGNRCALYVSQSPCFSQRDGVLVRLWAHSHRPIPHLIRLPELACLLSSILRRHYFRYRTYWATPTNIWYSPYRCADSIYFMEITVKHNNYHTSYS